ncbi:acyltransferase family protein [Actinoplanes sp. NPDC051411]|uniref:acyltransferase family protein n=1 Tax=Actinoplanes sp. NPDC051411 TaxID=3155522 RepID=UPI0034419CFB
MVSSRPDLFFVLSGYLITGLLLDAHDRHGRIDLGRFWRQRLRRLLPALILMLALVAPAVRQWEPAADWAARRGEMLAGLFYYANWHMIFAHRSYFDGAGALDHLWSLAIEEQFYVWWPLALILLLRRRRAWPWAAAALATASAVTMVLAYSADDPTRAYVGTDARAQQLLIGALLVPVVRRGGRPFRAVGAAAAGVSAGLLLVVSASGPFYYRGGATLVALLFAALIWSVERAPGSAVARCLSVRPVRWVGTVSYGIYLWHLPVIRFLPEVLPAPVVAPATVAVTLALATASYYLLERPIRYGRPRLALDTTRKVVAAGAAAAVFCALIVVGATTAATGLQAQQIADARWAREAADGTVGAEGDDAWPLCPDTTSICRRLVAKPGHPTVAVLGDSIARSLDPGFYDLARANGWGYVLAAHNGCGLTSLVSVEGPEQRWFLKKCAEETGPRIAQVLHEYHPDLVISSSRWELIAHEGAGGRTVVPPSPKWVADVHAGLRAFAQSVVRSGAALAMLTVLPVAPATPRCLRDPTNRACAGSPDALTAATNDIYRQVAADVPGVAAVSMQDVVCPSGRCPTVVHGMLVRFDGMHFTEAGAHWFVRALSPRLPIIHRPPPAAGRATPRPAAARPGTGRPDPSATP